MDRTRISYEVEKSVAKITLCRAEKFNAIDFEMAEELVQAFGKAKEDEKVRAVLLLGEGRAFCGGGDVSFFHSELSSGEMDLKPLLSKLAELAILMKKLPKPILCATQGAAAGAGFSLALLSDFCIAAETCRFIQAFVNIGLVPDTGSVYLLAKSIGVARATDLIMTGRAVSADEGKLMGFVYKVVPDELLTEEAFQWARTLADGPTSAYANMKQLLFETAFTDFEYFLLTEKDLQDKSTRSGDFREGVNAFVEKRKTVFKGR